jgi:hypothetical protein
MVRPSAARGARGFAEAGLHAVDAADSKFSAKFSISICNIQGRSTRKRELNDAIYCNFVNI